MLRPRWPRLRQKGASPRSADDRGDAMLPIIGVIGPGLSWFHDWLSGSCPEAYPLSLVGLPNFSVFGPPCSCLGWRR